MGRFLNEVETYRLRGTIIQGWLRNSALTIKLPVWVQRYVELCGASLL
jgi:hypothetical protein